jgi:4-hydroxymandelate oxidase
VRNLEKLWADGVSRRDAFRRMACFLAGSPLLRGQQDPFRDHSRVPGLNELKTAFDFESVAYTRVPRAAFDYTSYGADSEFTLRRNREAFDWVELLPRRVGDVSSIKTATKILGTEMPFPIFVSPSSGHGALHPEGEMATHKGATAANTPYIVSNASSFPFEKVAAAAAGTVWFQLYPREDINDDKDLLEKVQAAGAKGVVVTIDQQISTAPYERSAHDRNISGRGGPGRGGANARRPPRGRYGMTESRLWYEWKFFDQIRPFVKVPMLAKGILTGEDAKRCIDHGCDGVYVSNHGGRATDYSPSTLEQLPEIVAAVGGRVPILFDSGIRRGTDILKALALGANAICLGRVPRWGLGAYGAEGVQRVLEIMQAELVQAMAYTGRPSLDSIDKGLVRTDFA